MNLWTEQEDALIRKYYAVLDPAHIVVLLADAGFVRTKAAISQRAVKLKVTKQYEHPPSTLATSESVGHALHGSLVAVKTSLDDLRKALEDAEKYLARAELIHEELMERMSRTK